MRVGIAEHYSVHAAAGLIVIEAAVRVGIAEHYSVHAAAGLINVAAVIIIVALCMLTGPFGGLRLQRLVAAELAADGPAGSAS